MLAGALEKKVEKKIRYLNVRGRFSSFLYPVAPSPSTKSIAPIVDFVTVMTVDRAHECVMISMDKLITPHKIVIRWSA